MAQIIKMKPIRNRLTSPIAKRYINPYNFDLVALKYLHRDSSAMTLENALLSVPVVEHPP